MPPTIPETSSAQGELKKVKIYAYTNIDMADSHLAQVEGIANPYTALINPETYTVDIKYEFQNSQGQGTTGGQQQFKVKYPEEMSFDFLFDNTGIIDGKPKPDIADDIAQFKKFLMDYDGNIHEPRFFKLVWGTDLFKGRCSGLNIAYKLFNPDGAPIRALCKVTLKEATEEERRVLEQHDRSPDLTHYRVVKKGDTLPWMCYNIYGDPRYYLQVAAANQLSNFRNLVVGDELFFPPVEK
ncbi:CIS tube protein [Pseudocnuella soli]|uniref:CIS tube protein n=1 Tax=Pseudocnuella soli TaxID=2502779 RepID=UPI00104FB715|nr:LysM peptidoglycan-binding domain-containing protein [Pseudocnuella soli]